MSPARLAAEAAFAAPRAAPLPLVQPQVTVRRARRAAMPEAQPGALPGAAGTPVPKAQRVFRIDAPRAPESAPAAASAAGGAATPPGAAGAETAGSAPPRRRRASPDKRPGPVVRVLVATPAPTPEAPSLQTLRDGLAAVDPALEAIARAQAWRAADARFAHEWQRLAGALEALRAELHAHACRHRPGFEDYQAAL